MKEADKILVQVRLEPEQVRRIDELAEGLGWSRGGLVAELVTQALHDKEFLIKHVAIPIRRFLDRMEDTGKKVRSSES